MKNKEQIVIYNKLGEYIGVLCEYPNEEITEIITREIISTMKQYTISKIVGIYRFPPVEQMQNFIEGCRAEGGKHSE